MKSITINLYSFANTIYIYYQQLNIEKESDGRVNKKNKNIFTYHGPFHDLNAEIQKSHLQIQTNDLDELDNEVAMISQKSPKSQPQQIKEESSSSKGNDKDESNTRNFNSIPRNYNDPSESDKSETGNEETKRDPKQDGRDVKSPASSNSQKGWVVNSIWIFGAKGMQSKINLIPLYNIKTLFHRAHRNDEALEIEYMCGLSLIWSRR